MALEGLDLTIQVWEMMAIIGKSGSGKSTLLNIIGGLELPTAGYLMVDGKDLSSIRKKELVLYRRDKVGFVWRRVQEIFSLILRRWKILKHPCNFHPAHTRPGEAETCQRFIKGSRYGSPCGNPFPAIRWRAAADCHCGCTFQSAIDSSGG